MSRHNRRRTRGGHKASTSYHRDAFELPSSADPSESHFPNARYPQRSDLSANLWHNRYHAWQARMKRQKKEEYERLKEERKRIFGGDGTDREDDGLCSRMMCYFVSLKYLNG